MKYCPRCRELHSEEKFCEYILKELENNPRLLAEAANFATIAGQYHLVTSQSLDTVAGAINKLAGTKLSFEGTHQYMRDVQVFNQLNVDGFNRSGVFASVGNAQNYINNGTQGQVDNLTKKLNGTAQEVDWLRMKEGKLRSLFEKSKLLGEEVTNAPGVDGETFNRFTGERISSTTVKAAQDTKNLGTNVSDILKALDNGTLDPKDVVAGIEGTDKAIQQAFEKNIEKAIKNGNLEYAEKLKQAQQHMRVEEINTTETVKKSTSRLKDKMASGNAHSSVTMQEIAKKSFQGAVIGAAIGLTISAVSNYLRYKKGEITEKEAFTLVGRDTTKGALVGGAMSAVTIFLPGGALGLVAGMAIGIYLNATLTNVLDEVFGKGAFGAILDSAGYVAGMAHSLDSSIAQIQHHENDIQRNRRKVAVHRNKIDSNLNEFDELMKG